MAHARILAGFHAVAARLKQAPQSIETLYVDASRRDARMQTLLRQAAGAQVRVASVDAQRLHGMAGCVPHQGVVAGCTEVVRASTLDDLLATVDQQTLLVLLDGVTDPRNLGACLRTADAAGAGAVIVPRDRSAAMSEVVAKAAAGAADTVPLIAVTNLARAMAELKEAGIWIAGAAGEADRSVFELNLTGPLAWVFGAEGEGMRRLTREKCDWLACIPLAGSVDSLNVSVAAGVCLFETVRQRGQRRPPVSGGATGA